MPSTIEIMEDVVTTMKAYDRLVSLLDWCRQLHETPLTTLERLLKERQSVVRMLEQADIKRNQFDCSYKETFTKAVEEMVQRGK